VVEREHHVAAGLRLDLREQLELAAVRVDQQLRRRAAPRSESQPPDAAPDDVAEP
jgi:hypothetical protein